MNTLITMRAVQHNLARGDAYLSAPPGYDAYDLDVIEAFSTAADRLAESLPIGTREPAGSCALSTPV